VATVAIAIYAKTQSPPRILKLVPNPIQTSEILADMEGEAIFSVPMDRATVEYGIRFTEILVNERRGPYLMRDYVDFEWKDGDRAVTFRIKPEYRPSVGSVFYVEVAGLRGKNRRLLHPASFSATFRVVDLMTKSQWHPEDIREMLRRVREGDY
jgi:hypothetical protein